MTYKSSKDGKVLEVRLNGELDSITSLDVEQKLLNLIDPVMDMTFDLKGLDYISSAGLRILLTTQKQIKHNGGTMIIKNVQPDVLDTLKVTGFCRLFTIVAA